jgi:NADPH2:quinone reductase
MTVSQYWYFNQFGHARTVLEKGRQVLPQPGPGQAVVAIRAIGLNRADNQYMLGKHFPPKRFPACMSQEAVGEIIQLGPKQTGTVSRQAWQVGDRVAFAPMMIDMPGMGVLRELGVYDQAKLLPVPEAFSDQEAAAYWMGILTMAGAMEMAGLGPENCSGKTIVITAATGGVGTIGLQLTRAWGAASIATTRSQAKVERLSTLAAHVAVVDSVEKYSRELRRLCPQGADAIIDPLGGDFVGASVKVLASGGQYVGYEMVSSPTGTYDIMTLLGADASIHGFTVFRLLQHSGLLDRLVAIGMEYSRQLKPILAGSYSFDAAPEAYEALEKSTHFGKIVIII